MAYIPKERFVQIAAAPDIDGTNLFALDESGQVWKYDDDHDVWIPLSRTRGSIAAATGKAG